MGLVSVPALVRDRVSRQDAAKLFFLIGLILILAPGIAPGVGSLILGMGSWREIFYFLAAYGLSTRLPHPLPGIVIAMAATALVPVATMLITRRSLSATQPSA